MVNSVFKSYGLHRGCGIPVLPGSGYSIRGCKIQGQIVVFADTGRTSGYPGSGSFTGGIGPLHAIMIWIAVGYFLMIA